MKNWKTTLLGIVGGLAMLFGPRLQGDRASPAITGGNLISAIAIAALGAVAKDHDVTGGTKDQTK